MPRPKKLPEFLTDDELDSLLAQPNRRCPTGLRNACIMYLMSYAGLREAEALSLKVRDINWQSGKFSVRGGKGGKDRTLQLRPDTLALLEKWRTTRPIQTALLFTTLEGKPINARYIRTMVKREASQAGISKDVHPHMLRHTFATKIYRQTKDIRLTQKALGHADLSTTMIYTHVIDDDLDEAMRELR
jgi:integrase/recombinase XerD